MKLKQLVIPSVLAIGSFLSATTSAYDFGDNWTIGSQCKVLNSKKQVVKWLDFKHTGFDDIKAVGSKVTVKGNLYFHKIATDSNGWKDFVFACDKLSGSKCANDSNTTYYTFLHLDAVSGLKTGQSLKNVTIGTIADLSKKGAVSHLHLSLFRILCF